jgi:hypothetical protein
MAATFSFLLLWMFGGLLADLICEKIAGRGLAPRWSLTSPFYVFGMAGAWGRTPFWTALGITQLVAWVLLGLASLLLPRTWQERAARKVGVKETWSYTWRYGGARRRARLRRKLIERNPVQWLACRERWQALGLWTLAMIALVAVGIFLAVDAPAEAWMVWRLLGWVFASALYLWMASQAGRFFIEARRSGLVELLLATPIQVHEVVRGQWRALLRMFGPPIALVVVVNFAAGACSGGFRGFIFPTNQGTGVFVQMVIHLGTEIAGGVITAANLVAMCWFGMWMGMTSKNNNLATLKTLLLVQVVPWLLIWFASLLLVPLLLMSQFVQNGLGNSGVGAGVGTMISNWYPLITVGFSLLLFVGKDLLFLFWARGRLYASFREQAVRSLGGERQNAVVVPVVMAAPPPVIGAQG